MRVIQIRDGGRQPADDAIFVGSVLKQAAIGDESRHLRLVEVTFRDGARNKLHTHTTDQVLLVTAGRGIVATREEQRELSAGDLAFIPAGEAHWHGAQPDADMTHWAITGVSETKIVGD